VVLALAVVAAGAGVTVGVVGNRPAGVTTKAVPTVAADTGPVTVGVAATGTIGPAGSRRLSFAVDGTVEEVNVRAGSKVKAGASLAAVEDTDAVAAVSDARTALADAEARLADAKQAAAVAAKQAAEVAAAPSRDPAEPGSDAIFAAQEQVNQARATLAAARDALTGTTITAPIAGTVMAVAGQVGTRAGAGSAFITLADTYAMRVSASFPEADAGALAAGQAATVTLADRPGEQFAATVTRVDPVGTADGALVTYGAELTLTRPPADLLVGQSAAVQVTTGRVARTLRVPSTAVHDAVNGTGTVLVHDEKTGANRRAGVGVGLAGDQYTQITSGLAAGDRVIRSW
jgi:HlyD family secretion protein